MDASASAVESDAVKKRFHDLSTVAPDANEHGPEVLQQLVTRDLPRRLGAMLGAISRGVFVQLPSRPASGAHSPCGYCEFSTACARRDEVVASRQLRAADDAEALLGAYRPDAPRAEAAE